jgi:hypothetical protein
MEIEESSSIIEKTNISSLKVHKKLKNLETVIYIE